MQQQQQQQQQEEEEEEEEKTVKTYQEKKKGNKQYLGRSAVQCNVALSTLCSEPGTSDTVPTPFEADPLLAWW